MLVYNNGNNLMKRNSQAMQVIDEVKELENINDKRNTINIPVVPKVPNIPAVPKNLAIPKVVIVAQANNVYIINITKGCE